MAALKLSETRRCFLLGTCPECQTYARQETGKRGPAESQQRMSDARLRRDKLAR
jgi:hypothetical protein